MKRVFALTLCACFLLLTACSNGLQTEKIGGVHTSSGDLYPESVATVNGEAVSFDEFRYYYLNFRDMYLTQNKAAFDDPAAEEKLKADVMESILNNRAVKILAAERGVALSSQDKADARQEIADTIELYGLDGLIESLHASYMSQQMYRETTSFTRLYQKLFDSYFGENGTDVYSDDEFLRYYKDAYLAVQEIYLPYARDEKAGDCPHTMAKAETILAEYEAGTDFWKLVEAYGQDPGMELEPDGYYFTEGEAEDVLYQASAALKENEVSGPVEAAAGIYLIRRVAIKDEKALKRKTDVLEGYEDGAGDLHSGVYDELLLSILQKKSKEISVQYEAVWDEISSASVY